MLWAVHDRRLSMVLVGALIALAWLSLAVWGLSPYGRYLSHGAIEDIGLHLDGGYLNVLLLFVGGWTLMTVAMMLPTSLPLVILFSRLVHQRPHRARLVALVIAGYLSVWTLFGVIAHIGDLGLHEAVEQSRWLEDNAWLLGAGTLVLAGVYQFTPLKYMCLDKCRSPLSFITEHWRGGREGAQAVRLGIHHGLFCVGCCWSLMLLMFVVGVGNLGWMLALGTVMAVEKNMPWGRRLSAPLGAALLGWGLILVLVAAPGAGGAV